MVIESSSPGFETVLLLPPARDRYQKDATSPFARTYPQCNLMATEPGHPDIEQSDFRFVSNEDSPRRIAIRSDIDIPTFQAQEDRKAFGRILVVIRDQNAAAIGASV